MEDALWTQRNERNHRTHESRVKRLMEDALWTQGLRAKLESGKRRHEFQTDHGFRKWFKTRCELVGMKPINIEKLMNHSIGISNAYYRATENDLLEDYLKASDSDKPARFVDSPLIRNSEETIECCCTT
jgi:hypothetical protein